MKIKDNIQYIGVDDLTLDLFESQYIVPNGISYNSYIIHDDKNLTTQKPYNYIHYSINDYKH